MLLVIVWSAGPVSAQVTACASGRPSTATLSNTAVEPQPPTVVAKQLVKSITALGYKFVRKDSVFVTAPRWTWPQSAVFFMWRSLVFPGAEHTFVVQAAGQWTRLSLTTRLLCETGQHPPAGHPQDVDFQTFVLNQTHGDVWNAVDFALLNMKVRVFAESCAPLNEGDKKIAICAAMAKAHPTDSTALLQYVLALASFYRAKEAWTQLQNLVALQGERAHTYDVVGAAMLTANQFEDAGKLYTRATELWPHDPLMKYRLGRARLGLHQLGPAYESFMAAIGDDSAFVDAHTYAAVVSAQQARLDETRRHCAIASRELQRVLVDRAADVDAWLGLAFCASVYGRHQEAVADFARASVISASRAAATSELLDMINSSYALVGDQPPAPLPHR